MKICSACKESKSVSEFPRKRNGRASYCKTCQNIKTRAWYASNKERHKALVKRRRDKIGDRIKAIKEANPCLDCGESFPYYQLDFDHVRGKKIACINALSRSNWKVIEKEIAKCEVVCANCHRARTHKRSNTL